MRKGMLVCQVTLLPGSGMILQTGLHKEHFSWWRAAGFEPLRNCEVIA